MLRMVGFIKQYPMVSFLGLSYVITWLALSPLVLTALGLWGFTLPPYWHSLGAFGPLTAALLVSATRQGRRGLSDFWQRLSLWRVGWRWGGVMFFSSLGLLPVALLLLRLAAVPLPEMGVLRDAVTNRTWLIGSLLPALVYGLEEPGWRGFMQHHLQKHYPALMAVFIVSAAWAL